MTPGLCFLVAGAVVAQVATTSFTLAWTHSVERSPWEEDWAVEGGGLRLVAARIRGTGAGMEPPPEARLVDGWWRWTPTVLLLREVVLRRSGATADWRLCHHGACVVMDTLLPEGADPVTMTACAISP